MNNYSTIGHNLKRGIVNFCKKLSKNFNRPVQKFIADMVYGLIASKSCYLIEIARSLNEEIKLDKTVERLSRNLMCFDGDKELMENYFKSVKKNFDEETVLIFDDSDISKLTAKNLKAFAVLKMAVQAK